MSSTVFEDRYRLMKCVAVAGGIRTHHAQERATGRIVMVHVQDEVETGAQQHFQSAVERCPPPHNARILETALLPSGGFAVVTDFLQGFTSFRDWLAFRVPGAFPTAAAGQTGVIPAAGAPSASEPATIQRSAVTAPPVENDSATQIIPAVPATRLTAQPPTADEPPAIPATAVAPMAPTPTASKQPGEFTRMFGQVSTPVPPTAPVPGVAPPTLATPHPAAPAAPPSAPAPAPLSAPDSLSPGEFTRMFNAPAVPPSREGASPFASPPSAPAAGFGAARPPQSPSFPSPPRSGGSATHSFDAPGSSGERSPNYSAGQGPGGAPDALAAFGTGGAAPPERQIPSTRATDERRDLAYPLPPGPAPTEESTASSFASNLSNLSSLGSNFPSLPSPPSLPSLPSTSDFSPASALPALPEAPAIPSIPSIPAPPALPALPLPAMPQLPGLPGLGGGSPFGAASAPPMRLSPVGTPAPAPAASGGEYTRIIRAGVTPPPPAPAPAAASVATPAPRRTLPLGLIITMFVVLLLAAVLVLYFALRPAPSSATRGSLPSVPAAAGGPAASTPGTPGTPGTPAATTPATPATPARTP